MADETLNGESQLDRQHIEHMLRSIAGLAHHLLGCTEEAAVAGAERAIIEVNQLDPVLIDAGGEGATKHGFWGVNVDTAEGRGVVHAPKPSLATTKEEQIQSLLVLAIVSSPLARAVAHAQGLRLSFFQAPGVPEKKLIITG